MHTLTQSYQHLKQQIVQIAATTHHLPKDVALIVVSKKQNIDSIRALVHAGQHDFGENYLQEALPKISALAHQGIRWHFLGFIQGNKAKLIAQHFDWVHSLERAVIASALSHERLKRGLAPLNVLIQVNISGELTKKGIDPSDIIPLAQAVAQYPGIRLRGLMVLPSPDHKKTEEAFTLALSCYKQLQSLVQGIDTLSMGTSTDYEKAIEFGATHIRIGRKLFDGHRE